MATISWTELAQGDLKKIRDYIGRDSVYQAELMVDGIYEKAQILLRFPEFGKRLSELPEKDYRELLYKSYRIIYKIEEENIYILTVYHSTRLLKNNPLFTDET